MSFGLYTLGTLLLLAGVAYVGHLAHMPQAWNAGFAALLLGAGIAGGVTLLRSRNAD